MGLTFFLIAIVLAFYGLFMAAVLVKYREIKQARLWLTAKGKIVSSRSEARKVKRMSRDNRSRIDDTEIRNFAAVRYEFMVKGQKIRGERMSLATDVGNYQVAEKLARYPIGTDVTVFYDPARLQNCVLERNLQGVAIEKALVIGTLVGIVGILIILIMSGLLDWLSRLAAHPGQMSGAIFAAIMGLLATFMGVGLYRRGARTYSWPKVRGKILASTVDEVKIIYSFNPMNYLKMGKVFRSRTTYSYQVAGINCQSDRTSFGAQSYASFRLLARRGAAGFTEGQSVDVFYDPNAPEQAVLTLGTPGIALVWGSLLSCSLLRASFFGGVNMIRPRAKLSMLFILAIMMLSAGLARAGDAAARRIIGFSPDGLFFAYEQFGTLDRSESNSGWSEITIIDTRTGRIVGDKPIMAVDTNPDGGLTLAEARKRSDKQAKTARYAIGMPGERIAIAKETMPDELIAYDAIPTVEKVSPKVLDADVDHLGRWHFGLNETLVASESDCSASFAKFDGDSVEKIDKGRGIRISVTVSPSKEKDERIVYEDHFLPSSRKCPTSYSLSEAYLYRLYKKPPVIVVLVQFFSQGFEGPDRRFLAVVVAHSR